MVWLFLLAVLLAIPTWGGSIIAYVAFAVFKSYLHSIATIARSRERAALKEVLNGDEELPSWATSRSKTDDFFLLVRKGATRKGVPELACHAMIGNDSEFLLYFAGALEREGASYLEQQVAIVGFIKRAFDDKRTRVEISDFE